MLSLVASAAFVAGIAAGGILVLGVRTDAAAEPDLAALKASFRRPAAIPFPANNPFSEDKRALGERLFHDTALSVDGSLSCAGCHDRAKGFADGRAHGMGVAGRPLARHTPGLWNLAWASSVFWDGRAKNLEQQVFGPIESHEEMAQPLDPLIKRLGADRTYAQAFAKAFPKKPKVDAANVAQAIATYERALVSPPTRFDRWVDGDERALTAREINGFRLFTGKAACAQCHKGFAFTDYNFYDIGLAADDRGRGAVLQLPAAEHAFKTPGLRELVRSAPYMHDGSLATLTDVVRHYESGMTERPTLASELPRKLVLSDDERAALVAFLESLSSDAEPFPPAQIVAEVAKPLAPAVRTSTVTQDNKSFSPTRIALRRGDHVWILNNDTRTHNVRVFDRKLDFDSGAQEPGETVEIAFQKAGSYLVFCGIHPKMELTVDVRR